MRRRVIWVGLLVILSGCGDDGEARVGSESTATEPAGDPSSSTTSAGDDAEVEFGPISGQEVIAATLDAGSARATIETVASVADPGTEPGLSGQEEQRLSFIAEYDFAGDRSLVRWQFPPFMDEEPTDVEWIVVEGTTYVRDGRWLCPGCGLDGDEPLPSDEWISFPGDAESAFSVGASQAHQLGWISLVENQVESSSTTEVDGEMVAVYTTELPRAQVQARLDTGGPFAPQIQSDVMVTFTIDSSHRLRELRVEYHADDRDQTVDASLFDFGTSVTIEAPPQDEVVPLS
jgi:hypothetical protein